MKFPTPIQTIFLLAPDYREPEPDGNTIKWNKDTYLQRRLRELREEELYERKRM